MAFIKTKSPQVGDIVITKKTHSSCDGTFTRGSKVKIVAIHPVRGYAIEDEEGNFMCEIGWTI